MPIFWFMIDKSTVGGDGVELRCMTGPTLIMGVLESVCILRLGFYAQHDDCRRCSDCRFSSDTNTQYTPSLSTASTPHHPQMHRLVPASHTN